MFQFWLDGRTNKNDNKLPVRLKEMKAGIVKMKFFVLPIYRIKVECLFVGEESNLKEGE